jgi:hypothetical protein
MEQRKGVGAWVMCDTGVGCVCACVCVWGGGGVGVIWRQHQHMGTKGKLCGREALENQHELLLTLEAARIEPVQGGGGMWVCVCGLPMMVGDAY